MHGKNWSLGTKKVLRKKQALFSVLFLEGLTLIMLSEHTLFHLHVLFCLLPILESPYTLYSHIYNSLGLTVFKPRSNNQVFFSSYEKAFPDASAGNNFSEVNISGSIKECLFNKTEASQTVYMLSQQLNYQVWGHGLSLFHLPITSRVGAQKMLMELTTFHPVPISFIKGTWCLETEAMKWRKRRWTFHCTVSFANITFDIFFSSEASFGHFALKRKHCWWVKSSVVASKETNVKSPALTNLTVTVQLELCYSEFYRWA